MTNAPQTKATRAEKACVHLGVDKTLEVLSEPFCAVLGEAQSAAYAANMASSYSYDPREYESAMEKMRSAGAEVTDRDHKLLAKIWRAALSAASIDSEDFETPVGYRAYREIRTGTTGCY